MTRRQVTQWQKKRSRVAIVGGNFSGLTAAIKLSRRHAVTLMDPGAHFEWMPNIHELLSSVKTPQALRLDRTAILEQAGHRFVRDRVTVLQPARRRLVVPSFEIPGFRWPCSPRSLIVIRGMGPRGTWDEAAKT